jgi:hypothetical protein
MDDFNLCKYRDIFGKSKEGIHSFRIFNIAIVDLSMTILVACIIVFFYKKTFREFWIVLGILLLIGIILHKLFCVKTTIDKILFS